jgi:hypothetical protein
MPQDALEEFIEDVFGNILEVRECNRRLLEAMAVRKREQAPIIQRIGDVFLKAANEFRATYPVYVGNLPLAEKRVKEEAENNAEFRHFLEVANLLLAHPSDALTRFNCIAMRSPPRLAEIGSEALYHTAFGAPAQIPSTS